MLERSGVMWGRVRDWWTSPNRRPLWQIPLLLPLFAIYLPARAFVDWMDGK
jgi:hypothetical protein